MFSVKILLVSLLVCSCGCLPHGDQQLQVHMADLLTRLTQLVDKYEGKSEQLDRLELLVRCKPPSTLNDGVVDETVVDKKLVLKFTCNDLTVLKGNQIVMCDRGMWNGSFPTCENTCQIPDGVERIMSVKKTMKDGLKEVKFSCPTGSYLQGSEVLICDSSGWNASFPCCYTFKVGDQVKVKAGITKPKFAWGMANSDSVGPITRVEPNKIYVRFPKQEGWMAAPEEMELVPPVDCSVINNAK